MIVPEEVLRAVERLRERTGVTLAQISRATGYSENWLKGVSLRKVASAEAVEDLVSYLRKMGETVPDVEPVECRVRSAPLGETRWGWAVRALDELGAPVLSGPQLRPPVLARWPMEAAQAAGELLQEWGELAQEQIVEVWPADGETHKTTAYRLVRTVRATLAR